MLNFSFKYFTRKTLLRYIFFSWVPQWVSQKGDAIYIVLQPSAFKFHKTEGQRWLSVLSGVLTSCLGVTSQNQNSALSVQVKMTALFPLQGAQSPLFSSY